MKLCFSTLGCPRWTFDEIFSTAKDLGLSHVEVRGIGNHVYAPDCAEFQPQELVRTKEKLQKLDMKISILTSAAAIADPAKAEASMQEAKIYMDLAGKLEVPYIRVMGTDQPQVTEGDFDLALKNYRELCEYGKACHVTPLIETNGKLADSAVMREFIAQTDHENSGVLWDIHHPVRFFGENPADTAKNLKGLVKHVHIKDSIVKDEKIEYRMLGYGDIPVMDSLRELFDTGYDGCLSLEWLKRWNPDLQEPGIVFAHYVNYMELLLRQL